MNEELKLVRIGKEYCDYLRTFDERVPYNFNNKEIRPFVGVLFKVNNCKYFAPLSSPKPKHLKIKNKLDFLRLDGGKLGAINFNNMIPVQDNNVLIINLDTETLNESEEKYRKLLKKQIYWLNRNSEKVFGRAEKLYKDFINDVLPKNIKDRCCDFRVLEEKCKEYNSTI